MNLPRRPTFYLLSLLLLVLVGIVYYMYQALTSPELERAAEKAKSKQQQGEKPEIIASLPAPNSQNQSKFQLDPQLQSLVDELNSPNSTPQRDLEIVREFLQLYSKAFGSGYPIGQNDDITAALTGTANPTRPGHLFPPNSPHIRDGKLVDRWGTPLWFHPESGTKMEIRSAGPDKNLFTGDDIILDR